jgi:hypothetical protein
MRALALTLAFLAVAPTASADTVLASGPLVATLTSTTTVCQITNWAPKPVTFVNAIILDVPGQAALGATSDTCTTAPLLFAQTCTFSATVTGPAGGGMITVKGSAKAARTLRGMCRLQNPASGAFLQFDPMR